MKLLMREKGITGIETSIILISFVIVATIFSYAVISAGLFASQKSREVVNSSLNSTQSALELKGSVVAMAENTGPNGYVSQITFTLSNPMGGEPIDFTPPLTSDTNGQAPPNSPNKVVISYLDAYQKIDDLFWTLTKLDTNTGNNLLDTNELFQITIGNTVASQNGGNLADALLVHHLGPNTRFTIEIMTPSGSTLTLERITPSSINTVMDLDTGF